MLDLLLRPNNPTDIHKIYIDDESYNYGHGHAYECYGIDPTKGAIVIIRPDHRKLYHSR
jgi:hypothetical protein